ncbi:MAG: hypothetical protein JWN30_1024 [Bacilli bacterium]|nr:hypothetical protein [Bacilli bacterium]
MAEKELREVDIPWQHTALENWSEQVDPFIMSGDQYENAHDPGYERTETQELLSGNKTGTFPPFMHPTHDVTYDVE